MGEKITDRWTAFGVYNGAFSASVVYTLRLTAAYALHRDSRMYAWPLVRGLLELGTPKRNCAMRSGQATFCLGYPETPM